MTHSIHFQYLNERGGNSINYVFFSTHFPTEMILVAAFGVGIVILFAVTASIFLHRIRANVQSKTTRPQVSDELEGELLLQSDADATV